VRWEMENIGIIRARMNLKLSPSIVDKFVKKDREFVVYEAVGRDASGTVLFRSRRTHLLDFINRSAPCEGASFDSSIEAEKI